MWTTRQRPHIFNHTRNAMVTDTVLIITGRRNRQDSSKSQSSRTLQWMTDCGHTIRRQRSPEGQIFTLLKFAPQWAPLLNPLQIRTERSFQVRPRSGSSVQHCKCFWTHQRTHIFWWNRVWCLMSKSTSKRHCMANTGRVPRSPSGPYKSSRLLKSWMKDTLEHKSLPQSCHYVHWRASELNSTMCTGVIVMIGWLDLSPCSRDVSLDAISCDVDFKVPLSFLNRRQHLNHNSDMLSTPRNCYC